MSTPLILLLLAPLAGAVFAVSFTEVPAQRRILVAASCAATAGGAAAALFRTITGSGVSWRGFGLGPLTALLAAGSVACCVAAVARSEGTANTGQVQGALLAATAASVAPFVVSGVHLLAATLVASTLGMTTVALVTASGGSAGLRARRALTMLAASDVAALIALSTTVSSGSRLPPRLALWAAGALLAGALVRLGFVPAGWAADDAAEAHPCFRMLWLGPIRAQGLLLATFAVGTHRGVAYAAAAAAASTAIVASTRGIGDPRLSSLAQPGFALAVLGFALGGVLATWGAVLCLAAAYLAVTAWSAGDGWRDAALPTLGAFPAAALLPGAALVAGAAFQAAAVRPSFLTFAVPAAVAVAATGAAAARARPARAEGDRALAAVWAGVALAAAVAIATLPARATSGLAFPVADALGVGRLLSARGTHGVTENLAAVMAAAAVVAFVLGPGRSGAGGPPGRPRRDPRFDRWFFWWATAPAPTGRSTEAAARGDRLARRWTPPAAVLVAAAVGLAVKIYVSAAQRGFL